MSEEDEIEQAMERLQELQTKVGRFDGLFDGFQRGVTN